VRHGLVEWAVVTAFLVLAAVAVSATHGDRIRGVFGVGGPGGPGRALVAPPAP
jgi:hypothetical protein